MKKQTLRIFTMVSLLTVLMVASVCANADGRMRVNIPFAFTVADQTLPAGEYTFERNQIIPQLLMIRSIDGRATARGFTMHVKSQTTQSQARLVFHRYGNRYFLAQVWRGVMDDGLAFLKSRAERAAAKESAKHLAKTNTEPEAVSIALQ
jgi:hypothetical protein